MAIISLNTYTTGLVGDQVNPRRVTMVTTDSLATITTAGYMNGPASESFFLLPTDVIDVYYSYVSAANPGTFGIFLPSFSGGVITLTEWANPGDVLLPVVSGDFAVFNGTSGQIKDAGYLPSNAAKTVVVMAGSAVVANHIALFQDTTGTVDDTAATAINNGSIQAGLSGTAGTLISFPSSVTSGSLIVAAVTNASGNFNTTISNVSAVGQSQVISIPDSGATTANFLLNTSAAGQTISSSTASATPGTIRAVTGSMTGSNATMSSGNLVGVRGSVTYVGASGGFLYGVQGKLIPSGTLSGSSWNAAVFGQFDISAATVNAGQTACIWGDYGATSGTISDASGMRGIAMTNTTAAVLNAQDYRYGNATYLLELAGAGGTLNYYAAAGTSGGSAGDAAHCAAQKVIVIEINGVPAYIPVFTQNS